MNLKPNFYSPPRSHRPLITVPPPCPDRECAAITGRALAEPFIAAGAAVAFIRFYLLFFKGAHGLVVPPRHGTFLPVRTDSSGRATEKGLSPRGYERNEIIKCLVGTTKHKES